jgi:thiol-disulfide isomerase/thioredoxin
MTSRVTPVLLPALVFAAHVGAQHKTVQVVIQPAAGRAAAPSFGLPDASGAVRHLSDYRGKPVVVNLWATECGGCKVELPVFVRVSQRYKGRVTVVGISLDVMYEDLKSAAEGWARVKPFAASHGLTYPILLDDGSADKAFTVTALPATYLIDRAGRIAATYVGIVDADNLEANLAAVLAEQ